MNPLAVIIALCALALIVLMFWRYYKAIRDESNATPTGSKKRGGQTRSGDSVQPTNAREGRACSPESGIVGRRYTRGGEQREPHASSPERDREAAKIVPRGVMGLRLHRLTRRDALLIIIITLAYALVGFSNLGDTVAPQSFYRLSEAAPSVTIDLGEEYTLRGITYYTGSFHDAYKNYNGYDLDFSTDGENFYAYGELEQTHANTFHWVEREFTTDDIKDYGVPAARYVRLTAHVFPMELGELCIIDATTDKAVDPSNFKTSPVDAKAKLFDEQSLLPDEPSYQNSMYFDEIYHARTAREFLNGDHVYENTHPPLGKIIISLGISIFGMTPFGWRFMGVLFGVLMLPFCYALIKNMFGKSWLASAGTLIFAFDFMHYVQTRIATIDTYGLFFTILMYFFMYRFLAAGYDAPARTRLVPLALCGISFGLGVASKWTCFYAAAGLVALYVVGAVSEGKRLCTADRGREFARKFAAVLVTSVIFFVVIPIAIYALSYIPFARSNGKPWNFETIWANQTSMFSYHSGLVATHSYQSSWWQWLVDGRPILYFRNYSDDQTSTASFASFNSPLVAWAGLIATVALVVSLYRGCTKRAKTVGLAFAALATVGYAAQVITFAASDGALFTNQAFSYVFALATLGAVVAPFVDRAIQSYVERRIREYQAEKQTATPTGFAKQNRAQSGMGAKVGVERGTENSSDLCADSSFRAVELSNSRALALFIIIGALAQLLAWIAVTRCTFAYHYFPTSFFLVLAIAAVFDRWDNATGAQALDATPTGFAKQNRAQSGMGAKVGVERGTDGASDLCGDSPSAHTTGFAQAKSRPILHGREGSGSARNGSSSRPVRRFSLSCSHPAQKACLIFTLACVLLFALYYPVLTGLYAPNWYRALLKWIPSWPI